jgi:hypothetical protein
MPVAELLKQHGGKSSAKPKTPSAASPKKQGATGADKKQDAAVSKPEPKSSSQETQIR